MTMTGSDNLPTPYDLVPAPQLALISALERLLEMMVRTLIAQHPDVFEDEKPYWVLTGASTKMAEEVISDIGSLCGALDEYRYFLSLELEDEEKDPDQPTLF